MIALASSVAPTPAAPPSLDTLSALLVVVADPIAYKAKLDGLTAAAAEAQRLRDEALAAQAASEAARAAAQTAIAESIKAGDEAQNAKTALAFTQHDLDEREVALQVRSEDADKQLKDRTAELDARMTAMNAHEDKLIARENACTEREADLVATQAVIDAALADAQAKQADADARLAAILTAAGGRKK